VLSKATINAGSTNYAQGGVSAVLDKNDSFEAHITDTLIAGAGLCDKDIVNFTVSQGPERIQSLIDQGVPFTQEIDFEGKKLITSLEKAVIVIVE
jgi:L-aspartate oxidase